MTIAVVAEKPAVARDIAAILGADKRGEGHLHGGGYVVTWAIGHLVALALPPQMNPAWKRWDLAQLPMLPAEWPLVVLEPTRPQFEVVQRIVNARAVERVVCATDAGREGELIFRYIYDAAGCQKPVSRLWISSLTPEAIRDGFRKLRDGHDYDRLADAARGRSRADWLVGMNLSRAYSLSTGEDISVGRVQTPTLAILVERELAIRRFVPEDYLEVVATFSPVRQERPGEPPPAGPPTYQGTYFRTPERGATASRREEAKARSGTKTKEDAPNPRRLPPDGEEARGIVERARRGEARIESISAEKRRLPPPLLYDLTELQRHANRLFGFSAQRTLDLAQALYEQRKVISYPRTDSRHLSKDVAATLGSVVQAIEGPYQGLLAPGTGVKPLGSRFVDDAKVTDHHAIIPTPVRARGLGPDEQRIYDLICRRLLAAWHAENIEQITTVITAITTPSPPGGTAPLVDRYHASGTAVEQLGWKVVDLGGGKKPARKERAAGPEAKDGEGGAPAEEKDDQALPSGLHEGQPQKVLEARAVPRRTKPPARLTEGTLLTAMETAGKLLEEKELSDAMKDLGLGTPATRAAIIETLLKRDYVIRKGKSLEATDKGIGLIEVVHPNVKSPAMTGEWEARLKRMQRGEGTLPSFMAGIEAYVREVIGRVTSGAPSLPNRPPETGSGPGGKPPLTPAPGPPYPRPFPPVSGEREESRGRTSPPLSPETGGKGSGDRGVRGGRELGSSSATPTTPGEARPPRTPTPPNALANLLRTAFGFPTFRPFQEAVCRAATQGRDVLLVMPTGAGKSLCYQLPGVARAGTTLVISPLIALMEDQVQKLVAQGFAAARIHSGRDRAASRRACVDYLEGRLDFLFIAPERLRVPGFPEMLARRTPALVAVDEAHCISQWGHDFRPDYRMLGERLPALRPAPIIALTATATPRVQDDIVEQLGLASAARFIHGFRRTNLAIEALEITPGERTEVTRKLLAEPGRRPAIVYAPTRKHAEELASELGPRTAAYHAGMEASARDRIQTAFLSGRLEVVVATIAFGMGVDKADVRTVVHVALPGSLEGYYQEIGRAGRDGELSSAVLMHSFVDRRTHEFFYERDYPDPAVLKGLYDTLRTRPEPRGELARRAGIAPDVFDKALEKLWVHGGARIDAEDGVERGEASWAGPYLAQRKHRLAQLHQMARFAEGHDCRMLHLIRHFGDLEDTAGPCGICDVCSPSTCLLQRFRAPSAGEQTALRRILAALSREDDQPTGRLFRETFEDGSLDRRSFEHLLGGLVRAGVVRVSDASFEKDGEQVSYQRAALTAEARPPGGEFARVALKQEAPKRKVKAKAKGKGKPAPKKKAAQAARAAYFQKVRRRGR